MSIDRAMNTVARALRKTEIIPITSAGEAGYLFALWLRANFLVVTVLKNTAQTISENINKYGYAGALRP